MARLLRFCLAIALSACGSGAAPLPHQTPSAAPASTPASPSARTAVPSAERCHPDAGSIDFEVAASGIGAPDGTPAWAHALQTPEGQPGNPYDLPVTIEPSYVLDDGLGVIVQLETVVSGGAFSLSCPTALVPDLEYPMYGVWLDLDQDGACGPNNLQASLQLYGWMNDNGPVGGSFAASDFHAVSEWAGVVGLGRERSDFCYTFGYPVAD